MPLAKFVYKMQSILNIKYKLEEQEKSKYRMAHQKYLESLEVLENFKQNKRKYESRYKELMHGRLDILELNFCKKSIDVWKEKIFFQEQVVNKRLDDENRARESLNEVMKERKIYEKLRQKAFEDFLIELNEEEKKEIDELVSYTYNKPQTNEED